MKYLLVFFLLVPLVANASPVIEKEPKGCIYSCEGWVFHYDGKRKDHNDGLNLFVWSKQQEPPNDTQDWALDVTAAQKKADKKAKKVGLQ